MFTSGLYPSMIEQAGCDRTRLKNLKRRLTPQSNFGLVSLLFIFLFASFQAQAQVGALLWEENFDTLDPERWHIDEGNGCEIGLCGWGNQELEYYSPNNVSIEAVPGENGNSAVVFEVREEPATDTFGNNYAFTSGKIHSENGVTVQYGMIETRIRVPNLQNGLWPAFWMLGTSTAPWPRKGELDIMEMGHSDAGIASHQHPGTPQNRFVGSNAIFYADAACVPGNESCAASTAYQTDNAYVSTIPMNDRFMTYRMYWTDTEIRFTAIDNGVEYDMYDNPIPITEESSELAEPFYFLMNLAVGGTFTGILGTDGITAPRPQKMYIDYVRVYEYNGLGEVTLGNVANPEYGTFGVFTDESATDNQLEPGINSDIFVWNTASVGEGNEAPFEGGNVIAWNYGAPGQWFGGGVQARQALDMSTFLEDGELTFWIKIPADVSFRIGITDTFTNQNWVVFPASETAYGLVRNGQWGKATIPISELQGGFIALQSVEYPFAIVSVDDQLPSSEFQFAIDDILWEGGDEPPIDTPGMSTTEVGTISFTQQNSNAWTSVDFSEDFDSAPIVVMGDPSFNGSHQGTYRIRNVTTDGFEVQFDEWDYLDGFHTSEQATYIALSEGEHDFDGLKVIAGSASVDTSWQANSFSSSFASAPAVFARQVTSNDSNATTTRISEVSSSGFMLRLQEEEAADNSHASETVHYVAVETGAGEVNGLEVQVGLTADVVTHDFSSVALPNTVSAPQLIVGMQSADGADTSNTRYQNLVSGGFQVKVEEESSRDSELNHTSEVVGWMVLGNQVDQQTPQAVQIEAEDYVAYSDSDAGNNGSQYRQDDVDIESTTDEAGGFNVGWTVAGEWLEYEAFLQAGTYNIEARVASIPGGGALEISVDGQFAGSSSVAATGGWQSWEGQQLGSVLIPSAGDYTIRVNISSGNFNLNWLRLEPQ